MDPNAAKPDNPNIVNPGLEPPVNSSDPLSNLQNVVDAAKEAAAAQTVVPVQTPQVQFETQFGPGVTPPVAEVPVAQLNPSINTVSDLLAKGPQVVELQPEVKLPLKVQEFLDSVLNAAEKFKASEENKVTSS